MVGVRNLEDSLKQDLVAEPTRNQLIATQLIVELATKVGSDSSAKGIARRLGLEEDVVRRVWNSPEYRDLLDTTIKSRARSLMGKSLDRLEHAIEHYDGSILIQAIRCVNDVARTLHSTTQQQESEAAEADLMELLDKMGKKNRLKRADITYEVQSDPDRRPSVRGQDVEARGVERRDRPGDEG